MNTKFYVGYNHAESSKSFIVELTESEYIVVKKFLDAQIDIVRGGGYCGSCGISDKGFQTRGEEVLQCKSMFYPKMERYCIKAVIFQNLSTIL